MTDTLFRTVCKQRGTRNSTSTVKSSPRRPLRLSSSVAEAEPPRQPSRKGSSRSLEIESQTLLAGETPWNITGHADANTLYSFSLPGVKI